MIWWLVAWLYLAGMLVTAAWLVAAGIKLPRIKPALAVFLWPAFITYVAAEVIRR